MKLSKSLSLSLLVPLLSFNAQQALAVPAYAERVSIDTVVGPNPNANAESLQGAVSADGRYVVYESLANDLVASDTNAVKDIFLFDRSTNSTSRVSVSTSGAQANGESLFSDISDDGRYVVFASRASNLTADSGFDGSTTQIFLRDTVANTTSLVSTNGGTASGTAANGASTKPVISANGYYIAYESLANDISLSDTDTVSDIYRYNRLAAVTALSSLSGSQVKGNAKSLEASISDDGTLVAFSSDASNLGSATIDQVRDVFLRNMSTASTLAITSGAPDISGFTDSQQPAITADGKYVLFESFRKDLVANDTNDSQDVFLYDVDANSYTRMSVSTSGAQGDARSGHPAISSDGRYVVFESSATNLDTNDTNGVLDVFIKDRALGTTQRISVDSNGVEGVGISQKPRISTSGRFVVLSTLSSLVSDDTQAPLQVEDTYIMDTGRVFSDLNGDRKSDILWRHTGHGQNFVYFMKGKVKISLGPINLVTDQDEKIVGTGDFDGDGRQDIFWRNETTGQNTIYLMDGTTIGSQTVLNTIPTAWTVGGVGDFDGDGKDDVFWRNTSTGENVIYLMDGLSIGSSAVISTVANTNYNVVGVDDFNNDGKADVLWRNSVSGNNVIYLMDGTTVSKSSSIGTLANTDWKVAGLGDFDRDGKADILWRDAVGGTNWIYFMDGTTIKDHGKINRIRDLDWHIEQVGDFDGDGKDDILWRHAVDGVNWMYIMDKNIISASLPVNLLIDLDWKVHGDIGTQTQNY